MVIPSKAPDVSLLSEAKNLTFPLLSSSTLVIEDPVSLFLVFVVPPLMRPTESAMRWRRYISPSVILDIR